MNESKCKSFPGAIIELVFPLLARGRGRKEFKRHQQRDTWWFVLRVNSFYLKRKRVILWTHCLKKNFPAVLFLTYSWRYKQFRVNIQDCHWSLLADCFLFSRVKLNIDVWWRLSQVCIVYNFFWELKEYWLTVFVLFCFLTLSDSKNLQLSILILVKQVRVSLITEGRLRIWKQPEAKRQYAHVSKARSSGIYENLSIFLHLLAKSDCNN